MVDEGAERHDPGRDPLADDVDAWLAADPAWIPPASERTAAVYGEMADSVPVTGNLVPDAMLAALAVEHGLTVMTADTDFARFPHVRWENPLGR